jgi:hypothetical protein
MKAQINEIKRMQQLAGILKENEGDNILEEGDKKIGDALIRILTTDENPELVFDKFKKYQKSGISSVRGGLGADRFKLESLDLAIQDMSGPGEYPIHPNDQGQWEYSKEYDERFRTHFYDFISRMKKQTDPKSNNSQEITLDNIKKFQQSLRAAKLLREPK